MTLPKFRSSTGGWTAPTDPVPWIGLVLIVLAALMLIEAIRILLTLGSPPAARLEVAAAGASAISRNQTWFRRAAKGASTCGAPGPSFVRAGACRTGGRRCRCAW